MTYEEAIRLLHPDTTAAAIADIEFSVGNATEKINEACILACEAMGKALPMKPIKSDREIRYCEVWQCPCCGFEWSSRVVDYCYKCGQAIDWSMTENNEEKQEVNK